MKNTDKIIFLEAIVPEVFAGKRLDQTLTKLFPSYSRTQLQTWIHQHQVLVDHQTRKPRDLMKGGEKIEISAVPSINTCWEAQAIPLTVVDEDQDLLIINKPVGLVVHPAVGNPSNTLVNALLHHVPDLALIPRAGLVHRLDKNTSGLLVVAKTLTAHTLLVKQLQARQIKREYLALVEGNIISGGTIDEPIGRHPIHRKKMAVSTLGKAAVSHYRVVERFQSYTLVQVQLETGRTHQIRVHMAHIHHPIVGDRIYGGRFQLHKAASAPLIDALRQFNHQALHAQRLGLIHPATGRYQEWKALMPDDMQSLLKLLRACP